MGNVTYTWYLYSFKNNFTEKWGLLVRTSKPGIYGMAVTVPFWGNSSNKHWPTCNMITPFTHLETDKSAFTQKSENICTSRKWLSEVKYLKRHFWYYFRKVISINVVPFEGSLSWAVRQGPSTGVHMETCTPFYCFESYSVWAPLV